MNFTFFSSAHGTFSRIDHILGHKASLGKLKNIEIIPSIFSDHNAVRLDLNYRRKTIKKSNIWRLNNTLLNNQQIAEEIKKEIKICTESQGLAMIKLANLLCKTGKKVSELVAPLKRYSSSGEINSKVADTASVLAAIKARYTDGESYELDGFSVEYPDWHFNVRASNTEPLLRLIVEARDEKLMAAKRDELLKIIRG